MTTAAHERCEVCLYWQDRITAEKARALAGCDGAFDREKHARAELAEHQAHCDRKAERK